MKNHEDIIDRMAAANPVPDLGMITDGQLAELMLQVEQDRTTSTRTGERSLEAQERPASGRAGRGPRSRWFKPAVAFAAALVTVLAVLGIVGLLRPDPAAVVDEPAPSLTTVPSATSTTAPETAVTSTTTIVAAAGDWNPILAETRANPAAVAATCPTGADPDVPGSAIQDRPAPGWAGLLAGAFDTRTGRIVYLDEARETWSFDVCTNAWQQMSPSGEVPGDLSGGLVYDVDSDVTVALGFDHISAYDANDNTWIRQGHDLVGIGRGQFIPMGTVYDPVSGLIVTTELTDSYLDAWAYDVDTNTWTQIGRLWDGGEDYVWFELLGYSREADRFIFASVDNRTALVDPRTGTKTIIETATPAISFGWPKAQYGPAADTTFVAKGVWVSGGMFDTQFPDQVCAFDIDTSTWTLCFPMPGGSEYAAFAAMVGDPINDRLVLVHGVYGSFWGLSDDGVWAVALDTGETIELLAPTQRRARTGPS